MPLYVKDREVGELADRLAAIKGVSKTEAVRVALENEIGRSAVERPASPRVEEIMRFVRELREKAGPGGTSADKAWIDSLYEDD
ncbi:MAG TPA: transcription factor [Aurantimonas coralicida]|uniref:Transcription factor n=2 Tax=root TaxID=1 RepID=A0A9C9NIN1_9HYPH|nr:transcription factor [Aurantimonas coralicida]HEU02382.1 transcription factor [Aurantimonas coralicida]